MPERYVAVCYGPSWWGDPTVDPAGHPVRLEDEQVRTARAVSAGAERAGIVRKVDALPDGCVVVHTASRGAGELFAAAAAGRQLPTIAAPPWPVLDQSERDALLIDVAVGLKAAGWLVKGLVAQPDEQPYDGHVAALADTLTFGMGLAEREIAVGSAYPYTPKPEPEDEPSGASIALEEDVTADEDGRITTD